MNSNEQILLAMEFNISFDILYRLSFRWGGKALKIFNVANYPEER